MKQIIIVTLSLIATAWGLPNEKCRPSNAPNATFEDCCPLGFDIIPQEALQKCKEAFPMPPPPPAPARGGLPGPPRGCCMSECVLKELKIYADGKFNKDTAKAYLTNAAKAKPELKPIIESAVDKCAADLEAKKAFFNEGAKLPPIPPANQTCSMASAFVMGCVFGHILTQCPTLVQKPECTELKQFATDCGMVFPGKKAT